MLCIKLHNYDRYRFVNKRKYFTRKCCFRLTGRIRNTQKGTFTARISYNTAIAIKIMSFVCFVNVM